MNLGESIRSIRKETGMSQARLAGKAGLSCNAMNGIERGRNFPSMATLNRIAQSLEVPVSYILLFAVDDDDIPAPAREQVKLNMDYIKKVLMKYRKYDEI